MDLKKFIKKKITEVDLPKLNLCVQRLRPEVIIMRTKEDPGAIHIIISTKGGVVAILRYAYSEKALDRDIKHGYTAYALKTLHNTAHLVIGNYHEDPHKDEDDDFIDVIFEIFLSNHEVPNAYDKDGFIRLVRRWNNAGGQAKRYGDKPKEAFYASNVRVMCYGIRDEKDEAVVGLIDAITVLGNKVDVHYYGYGLHDTYTRSKVHTMLMRNPDMIDAMDDIAAYGVTEDTINRVMPAISDMFERVEDMPVYRDSRKRDNSRLRRPMDGYFMDMDEYDEF